MLKDKKVLILVIVVLLIIFIGIGMTSTKGLNYGLIYSKNVRLNMYVDANFDENEIKRIAKEVLGNGEIYVQRNINDENFVAITAKEISDEQINGIIQKINEKYGLEMVKDTHTYTMQNGHTRGRDIMFPYAIQIIIAVVILSGYLYIMYRKIGTIKVISIIGGLLVIPQLLYLSALVIIRIPINRLTMPISLLIFLITTLGITIILEKLKVSAKKNKKSQKK